MLVINGTLFCFVVKTGDTILSLWVHEFDNKNRRKGGPFQLSGPLKF